MSGVTQNTSATEIYNAAKYVINGTSSGTPAFVMVCAGDGAHSGDVPANVKAAVDQLNASPNGRNYHYLKPSDLTATWRKWKGLQVIPPSPAPTPTPEPVTPGKVDDRDSTVQYQGAWNGYESFSNYFGTLKYSNDTGGYVQYTFTGTGIQWIGDKESNDGKANVYIDGVLDTSNIDLYAYPNKFQQILYSKTGLSNGSHTIKIVPTGTKNASSYDTIITVDAFQVIAGSGSDLALTATATATSSDTGATPPMAIDGNPAYGWGSGIGQPYPQYLTLNWSSGQTLKSVTVDCAYCLGSGVTNFDVQVSADGSTNWTNVVNSGTLTYTTNDATVEAHTVTFTTQTNMKGLRIKVNSAYNQWGHCAITELLVYNS
jgi:hypothetical protein